MLGYILFVVFLVIAYLWYVNEKAHEVELKSAFEEGYKAGLNVQVVKICQED